MRAHQRLTAVTVASLKRPGMVSDGLGLYLRIASSGTKSWVFRFTRGGRAHDMGLGPAHTVTLSDARAKAADCRKLLIEGKDPIEVRRLDCARRQLEELGSLSFQECAERYMASHDSKWRSQKHRAQWKATLSKYAFPLLGLLPVSAVNTQHVLRAVTPIWSEKPETANRVRGRIETVLDWASASGFREGANPARWRGHIDKLLPSRPEVRLVRHHSALPFLAINEFMAELRTHSTVAAKALEFTILTAARTSETLGAQAGEFDRARGIWTVPGARMKSGREHRVPLSAAALDLLARVRELCGQRTTIFPNLQTGRPLSNMAMLSVLARMQRFDLTVHGFRSTFRDWAAERTNFQNEVIEMALAHSIGDKVEAAYRRGDLFEKRLRLMEAWADFCGQPIAAGQLLPLRSGAKI